METEVSTTLYACVVRSHGGKLRLRELQGILSIDSELENAGFEDGDLLALTVVQKRTELPPLSVWPPQHNGKYGAPVPFRYAPEARLPDLGRIEILADEEMEAEPVA